MNRGSHLIADCRNVSRDVCLDDRSMLKVLAAACEKAGATVISQVRYRFGDNSPPGFTAVVVLDESHCTAHSYADDGALALDIFTCGTTPPTRILEFIREELDLGEVQTRTIQRFDIDDPSDDSPETRRKPRASSSEVPQRASATII